MIPYIRGTCVDSNDYDVRKIKWSILVYTVLVYLDRI